MSAVADHAVHRPGLLDRLDRVPAIEALVAVFAVLALLVIWSEAEPFKSLQDFSSLDDPTRGSAARRAVTLGLAALSLGLLAWRGQLLALFRIASLPLVLVFAWFGFSALASASTGLAINRLALAGFTILIAGSLPLLFTRLDRFVAVLGLAASVAVAASYLGVVFAPDLAVHSPKDAYGHDLAGDWRGLFAHKNALGAMAVHFVFIGLLLARTRHVLWGAGLTVAALALLLLSGGKTAMLLIGPALVIGGLLPLLPGRALGGLLVLAVLAGLLALTLGGVVHPPLASLTAGLVPDATFTGRTDIWSVAVEGIEAEPLLGWGYASFWDSGQALALAGRQVLVFDAHNGYLEAALSAGLPGLALVLLWAGLAPWRAVARIREAGLTGTQRAVLTYLAQAWLFTLLISTMESVLFNRGQSVWFMGALAILALRHWDVARRKAEAAR